MRSDQLSRHATHCCEDCRACTFLLRSGSPGLAEPLAVVVVALVLPFDLPSTFVEAALAGVAGIMVVRNLLPLTTVKSVHPDCA